MPPQRSHFNLYLALVLVLLFALTLGVFIIPMLASDPGNPSGWIVLANTLLTSIPLVLLYGSIYVLGRAWHERTTTGGVDSRLGRIIQWAPRLAVLVIALFMGLFSLDVFGEGAPPLQVLGAFLIHNIPSITLLLILAVAWKRPAVGFGAFLLAAAAFLFLFVRDSYMLPNLFLFVFPILLTSALFYADWKWLRTAMREGNA